MYVVDNPITLSWVIEPTGSPLPATDYDILVVTSELDGSYTDNGITDYLAPTAATSGSISYTLTVNFPGRYKLILSTGTGISHTVIDTLWLYVFGSEPSIVGRLQSLSPKSIVQAPPGIPPLDNFVESTFIWQVVQGFTTHPDPNKVVILGHQSGTTGQCDIGIYNLVTDTLDFFADALPADFKDGTSITYSPALDIYVALVRNPFPNGVYNSWWSTNLSDWTLTSAPLHNFSGRKGIWWDINQGLFFWDTGTELFVSADGKVFVKQRYDLNGSSTRVKDTYDHIVSGELIDYPNLSLWTGSSNQLWLTYNQLSVSPIPYQQVIDIGDINPFSVDRGIRALVSTGKYIIIMSGQGDTARSLTGASGSWEVLAELNTANTNIFMTNGITTIRHIMYINKKLWVPESQGGAGEWHSSSDDGETWVQSDTGPFGTNHMAGIGAISMPYRIVYGTFGWVYMGYDTNIFQYHVYKAKYL